MREIIARWTSLFAVGLVVALSWVFAQSANPGTAATSVKPTPPLAAAPGGRAIYDREKCATCHSIAGKGNPRYPLDGAGSRWSSSELKDWVTATGIAADVLPPAVAKRKERYRVIPAAELDSLIGYLNTLKEGK